MAIRRGPAEFTIITPALSDSALKTLVTNFATLQTTAGNLVISNFQQLGQATLTLQETWLENITQASKAPITKTKGGLKADFEIDLTDDAVSLFTAATNGLQYAGTSPSTASLVILSDSPGLTTGSSGLPYKTIVARPYVGQNPDTNANNWIIFPNAGIELNAQPQYGLDQQFSYKVMMTAYDPENKGWKVLRGDPSLLPS